MVATAEVYWKINLSCVCAFLKLCVLSHFQQKKKKNVFIWGIHFFCCIIISFTLLTWWFGFMLQILAVLSPEPEANKSSLGFHAQMKTSDSWPFNTDALLFEISMPSSTSIGSLLPPVPFQIKTKIIPIFCLLLCLKTLWKPICDLFMMTPT